MSKIDLQKWNYIQPMNQRKLNENYNNLTDMTGRELVTLVPLAIIVIVLGVYPAPLLDIISPTLDSLIDIIQGAPSLLGMR